LVCIMDAAKVRREGREERRGKEKGKRKEKEGRN
jgi:hypothetical protein